MERREKKSNVLAFFEGLAPQVERLSPQVFQTLIDEQWRYSTQARRPLFNYKIKLTSI